MIVFPGVTYCSKCGKPLQAGEFAICNECENEEKELKYNDDIMKEIKGKNLFEVNGIKYIDNISKNMWISVSKEQYVEYLQQKELIKNLTQENEELRTDRISKNRVKELIDFYKHKDFIMMMVVNGHDEESLKIVEVLKNLLEEDKE